MVVPRYTYNNLNTKPNYNYSFPVGISYILGVLKKKGYSVDCINLNHCEGTVSKILDQKLDEKKYDIVCTGSMALDYSVIEHIINISKNHTSKPKFILGGMILTSEPFLMTNSLNFDIGVIGEGEETIIDLLETIEKNGDLKNVKGIVFRDEENKPIFTEPRKPIEDLDKIPYPDFEAIEFDKILENMSPTDSINGIMDYPRTYLIFGSRGCPFNCTFCYHGIKYRTRSNDEVIKEIEYAIKRYKINSFNFNDDLFSINRERLNDFCEKMKKLNEKIPGGLKWRCSLWVGTLDEEMLEKLKEAGCVFVALGFESYSPIVLKSMKKPITPEQIDKAFKACMRLNMPIEGNFIFGDIAETKETAKETMDYWKENCQGQIKLFFIHPYPGSEIYDHCIKKGIIKDKLDFIKNKMHHTNIINMTNEMSDKEFKQLVREVYKLKSKYEKYVVPSKIENIGGERYKFELTCPFCKEKQIYKNFLIKNKNYFSFHSVCRNENCRKRFFIVSRLYKFTTNHYVGLDFLRKKYLSIRDNLLKKRLK